MDFALKTLFKNIMYTTTNAEIKRITNLHEMYEVCYSSPFFESLEGLLREGVSVDRILTAADAAYQEVCVNA